jgi:uncharacterized protein YcgL (UPF0745 family)
MNAADVSCSVYKSNRKELLYLYVEKSRGLDPVPEALLLQFGDPVWVMDLVLNKALTLATEDVGVVMDNLLSTGYHLQMPPIPEHNLNSLHNHKKPLA